MTTLMKSETQTKTTSRAKAAAPKETPTVKLEVLPPKTRTTTPKKKEAAKPATAPTRDEIARRAYEIYVGRGQAPGRELEDWAQAERELKLEAASRNN